MRSGPPSAIEKHTKTARSSPAVRAAIQKAPHISIADLERIITLRNGSDTFAQNLNLITNDQEFVCVLGRYVQFNSVFGGGVANLAGELAVRQDIFRDSSEPLQIMADRSTDVAADIFVTAIDEFDNRLSRSTHRHLAQTTLRAAACFAGCENELDFVVQINESTQASIRKVLDGYAINQNATQEKLFRALGFHLGSEILADQEFRILDNCLQLKHPYLLAYLEKTTAPLDAQSHTAYTWISLHTTVEKDHFESTLSAANKALLYYTGKERKADVKGWILKGFEEFVAVQAEFMGNVCDCEHIIEAESNYESIIEIKKMQN